MSIDDARKYQRGAIVRYYSVMCGSCGSEYPLDADSDDELKEEARRGGYEETQEYGWVCQVCRDVVL